MSNTACQDPMTPNGARVRALHDIWKRSDTYTGHAATLRVYLLVRSTGGLPFMQEGVQGIRRAIFSQKGSSGGLLLESLRHTEPQLIPQAPQESAPALKPTLKLYKELYRRGFSVTFITGRYALWKFSFLITGDASIITPTHHCTWRWLCRPQGRANSL